MTSGGALMLTARAVAAEATAEYPQVTLRMRGGDPVDRLVNQLSPLISRSVDSLQVAAALETAGITDRVARVQYGYTDVFELAEVISRRVRSTTDLAPAAAHEPGKPDGRIIGHGALYLMPAAVFPAAMAAVGGSTAVLAIVLMAAAGWIFSGVAAWWAYRLLGDGQPGSASRLLRWAALSAVPLGVAVTGVVVVVGGVAPTVMLLAAAVLAYQLAVTILVIYRREALLLLATGPAFLGGLAYLTIGPSARSVAILVALLSVVVAWGLALAATRDRRPAQVRLRDSIRRDWRMLAWVSLFTVLSAAFFLYPLAPLLVDRFDAALAALPLMAGMGVVEWSARRFPDNARLLLARATHPRQFAVRIWFVVANGLAVCFVTVGVLAGALLGVLMAVDRYSEAAAIVAHSAVLLACAYFLGFLLANLGRYGWLCLSLVLGLATYQVARFTLPGVLGDTHALRIAAATLLLLYLTGLVGFIGQARRHR